MTNTSNSAKYKNISPAKKIRNMKRLLNFKLGKMLQRTLPSSLSVCHQERIFIPAEIPKLYLSKQTVISIAPKRWHLSYSTLCHISIPPIPQQQNSSNHHAKKELSAKRAHLKFPIIHIYQGVFFCYINIVIFRIEKS